MDEEIRKVDTWIMKHGIYECGNCGAKCAFVPVKEMGECYQCHHHMKWYESPYGIQDVIMPAESGRPFIVGSEFES